MKREFCNQSHNYDSLETVRSVMLATLFFFFFLVWGFPHPRAFTLPSNADHLCERNTPAPYADRNKALFKSANKNKDLWAGIIKNSLWVGHASISIGAFAGRPMCSELLQPFLFFFVYILARIFFFYMGSVGEYFFFRAPAPASFRVLFIFPDIISSDRTVAPKSGVKWEIFRMFLSFFLSP